MNHRPKFRKNGEISWFSVRYNMWFRTRACKIPIAVVRGWDTSDDIKRWSFMCPEKAGYL